MQQVMCIGSIWTELIKFSRNRGLRECFDALSLRKGAFKESWMVLSVSLRWPVGCVFSFSTCRLQLLLSQSQTQTLTVQTHLEARAHIHNCVLFEASTMMRLFSFLFSVFWKLKMARKRRRKANSIHDDNNNDNNNFHKILEKRKTSCWSKSLFLFDVLCFVALYSRGENIKWQSNK